MNKNPRSLDEISARLSEIGAELARHHPFARSLPNYRELIEEQRRCEAEYMATLTRTDKAAA